MTNDPLLLTKIGHSSGVYVCLPLIEQRPADSAGAEVRHVLILVQPVDRLLHNPIVSFENGAVAWQQILRLILENAVERADEIGNIRAMMRVYDSDATVLVDVVAAEKKVTHLEAELAGRVAGCVPDLELRIADLDEVALVEKNIDLAARHGDLDPLGLDC